MGANAQTSVPDFTAGQILTAAQMTEVNTGIPVFADSSARDAAFGGTDEKTLAEGQYAYLEDTNVTQFYDGSVWAPVGVAPGLVLVSTETVGSGVSSFTSQTVFSSTYDNYKITYSGGVGSTGALLQLQLRISSTTSTTGYDSIFSGVQYAGAGTTILSSAGASTFTYAGRSDANNNYFNIDLLNPFLSKYTYFGGVLAGDTFGFSVMGRHAVADSYDQIVITPSSGTLTGGQVRVYGYKNS
jgi:hypothetical protein